MNNPFDHQPARAVAGLSEVLLALGDELRRANYKVGDSRYHAEGQEPEPILFLQGASVELAINVTADANGGLKVWVLEAGAGGSYERSGKVTVHLSAGGQDLGVGK